jgi:hypothetical protein
MITIREIPLGYLIASLRGFGASASMISLVAQGIPVEGVAHAFEEQTNTDLDGLGPGPCLLRR